MDNNNKQRFNAHHSNYNTKCKSSLIFIWGLCSISWTPMFIMSFFATYLIFRHVADFHPIYFISKSRGSWLFLLFQSFSMWYYQHVIYNLRSKLSIRDWIKLIAVTMIVVLHTIALINVLREINRNMSTCSHQMWTW